MMLKRLAAVGWVALARIWFMDESIDAVIKSLIQITHTHTHKHIRKRSYINNNRPNEMHYSIDYNKRTTNELTNNFLCIMNNQFKSFIGWTWATTHRALTHSTHHIYPYWMLRGASDEKKIRWFFNCLADHIRRNGIWRFLKSILKHSSFFTIIKKCSFPFQYSNWRWIRQLKQKSIDPQATLTNSHVAPLRRKNRRWNNKRMCQQSTLTKINWRKQSLKSIEENWPHRMFLMPFLSYIIRFHYSSQYVRSIYYIWFIYFFFFGLIRSFGSTSLKQNLDVCVSVVKKLFILFLYNFNKCSLNVWFTLRSYYFSLFQTTIEHSLLCRVTFSY